MSENETKSGILDDASLEGIAGGGNSDPYGQTNAQPADKTWQCRRCRKTKYAATKPSTCWTPNCPGKGDDIIEMIAQRTIKF